MSEALIQKKYFIGTSSKDSWSSVYAYKPQNPEYREKRGEVFAAIQLKGPENFSLGTAGGLLLDRFHEAYFENEVKPKLLESISLYLTENNINFNIVGNDVEIDFSQFK